MNVETSKHKNQPESTLAISVVCGDSKHTHEIENVDTIQEEHLIREVWSRAREAVVFALAKRRGIFDEKGLVPDDKLVEYADVIDKVDIMW